MKQGMNQQRQMKASDKKSTGKKQQNNDGLTLAQTTEQTSDYNNTREITRANTGTLNSGKTR